MPLSALLFLPVLSPCDRNGRGCSMKTFFLFTPLCTVFFVKQSFQIVIAGMILQKMMVSGISSKNMQYLQFFWNSLSIQIVHHFNIELVHIITTYVVFKMH